VGAKVTVKRRQDVVWAQRGGGADRDGFVPVAGVKRTK
jgi:hypothetical protein